MKLSKTPISSSLYRNEAIDVNRVINLDVKDANIETILNEIFSEEDFYIQNF